MLLFLTIVTTIYIVISRPTLRSLFVRGVVCPTPETVLCPYYVFSVAYGFIHNLHMILFFLIGKSNLELIPLLHLVLLMDNDFNQWEDLFLFHLLCTYHEDGNRPIFLFNQARCHDYRLIYGQDDSPWSQERLLTVTYSPLELYRYAEHILSRQSVRNRPTPSLSPAVPRLNH